MKRLVLAVLFVMTSSLSLNAVADGHSTLRVVSVSTSDVGAYVVELRKGKAMMAKLAPKMEMRAWQATFAGADTGAVVVALEHPGSLADFAAAWEKTLADKGMAEWLAGLGGLRTLVSDSIYRELSL